MAKASRPSLEYPISLDSIDFVCSPTRGALNASQGDSVNRYGLPTYLILTPSPISG